MLEADIPTNDIDCAHRVGGRKDGKQIMLVRFIHRDHVETIIKNRHALKNSDYVIYEDTTYGNRKLLNRLHVHPMIKQSWYIRGKVWGLTHKGLKVRFVIYDDIAARIREQTSKQDEYKRQQKAQVEINENEPSTTTPINTSHSASIHE